MVITQRDADLWLSADVQAIVHSRVAKVAASLGMKKGGRIEMGPEYEDLLSVAKIATLKGIHRWEESKGVKLTTWVYKCVSWALQDHLRDMSTLSYEDRRSGVKEYKVSCTDFSDERTHAPEESPYRQADYKLTLGLLAKLDEKDRVILEDRYLNGLTPGEVAVKHRLALRVVFARISVALENLRRALEVR